MKLNDLEPAMDTRRPLRFAKTRPVGPATEPHWQRHVSPLQLAVADLVDCEDADRAARIVAHYAAGLGRQHDYWRQEAVRLHDRADAGPVRARAAESNTLFTGTSTGLLVALWHQESDQLRLQLHADFLDLAADLAVRGDVSTLHQVKATWAQLNQFDLLDRAFNSNDVLALSPGANAAILRSGRGTPGRLAGGFRRRSDWQAGVLWSPDLRALVCWAAEGPRMHLFEIGAADLAAWIDSLRTPEPTTLTWRYSEIPPTATLSDDTAWVSAATHLTALLGLGRPTGTVGPHVDPNAAARMSRAGRRVRYTVPTTRFFITAAESRFGVPPFALSTSITPSDSQWVPARYRNTWCPAQQRYLRVWADAHPTSAKPAAEPVLVTVLP